jgi:hypothetical protein
VIARQQVTTTPKRRLRKLHASFNPATVRRQIRALCDALLTLTTAKNAPTV